MREEKIEKTTRNMSDLKALKQWEDRSGRKYVMEQKDDFETEKKL